MRRLAAILGGIAALSALGAACVHCGDGGSASDGGRDADAAPADAERDQQLPDAGDGWRHLTEAQCVGTLIATDVARVAPTIRWIPCTGGPPGCQLLDPVAFQDVKGLTRVTLEVSGNAAYAKTVHRAGASGGELQHTFYRVQDWSPVGALRFLETGCTVGGWLGESTVVLVQQDGRFALAHGDLPSVMREPRFDEMAPALPQKSVITALATSDTRFAFDLYPELAIGQASLGTKTWTRSLAPPSLTDPVVHGDDTFAFEEYGPGGWAREHVVRADGTVLPFVDVGGHRVIGFATDGVTLFWTEGYGGSPGQPQQPVIEIHAAPYTNEPTALAQTAKTLATIPAAQQPPSTVRRVHARSDFYAVWTGTIFVIRASDGAWREVDLGPDWAAEDIAFLSASELWLNVWRRNTPTRTVMRVPLANW